MILSVIASLALNFANDPMLITWTDLLPDEDQAPPVFDPNPDPQLHDQAGVQTGSSSTVAALDGAYIKMPGYMLPLDYTEQGKVSAFLLVPFFGACIHVPPPPPNQIVFVETGTEPVETRGLWDPVWVTGTMRTELNINGLGDAAYTLSLDIVEPYED